MNRKYARRRVASATALLACAKKILHKKIERVVINALECGDAMTLAILSIAFSTSR
jgi:hypothetical protein